MNGPNVSGGAVLDDVPDPVLFTDELRVTIQRIGAHYFLTGQDDELKAYCRTNPVAGDGLHRDGPPALFASGIFERVDDCCSAAFVYCREPQPVRPVDVAAATADVGGLDYEETSRMERSMAAALEGVA